MTQIQSGDVIFYKPTGLLGRIISKITKSPYSHVALAVSPTEIIEANFGIKTRLTDLYYIKNVDHIYRLKNVTVDQRQKIVNKALQLIDTRYDYAQIFGILLRLVFHTDKDMFNSLNKNICSELIDKSFALAGVPRKDLENLFDVDPGELFKEYDLIKVG